MNQVVNRQAAKPCIQIEVRGNVHTGKTAVAAVITKALREAFPGKDITLFSTDGDIEGDIISYEQDPAAYQERLRNAGAIEVVDYDNRVS